MYKEWLYLTCKWATKGLDGDEFSAWNSLTAKLDKHCRDCKEGYVCTTCKNSGLALTGLETMIVLNIESSLDLYNVHSVQ